MNAISKRQPLARKVNCRNMLPCLPGSDPLPPAPVSRTFGRVHVYVESVGSVEHRRHHVSLAVPWEWVRMCPYPRSLQRQMCHFIWLECDECGIATNASRTDAVSALRALATHVQEPDNLLVFGPDAATNIIKARKFLEMHMKMQKRGRK